ncbi:hypothetical protein [Gemmata sp.]|uniref:hypothetical protein n=1 Tax=Gemmata sp. TaxID=1914242 RepID=UPI003F6FB6B4
MGTWCADSSPGTSAEPPISDRLRELVDAYLDETVAAADLAELEGLLRTDAAAHGYFARYARTHTDLALEVASRAAAARTLAGIPRPAAPGGPPAARTLTPRSARWVAAASLLLGVSIGGGAVGLLAAPARPGAGNWGIPATGPCAAGW